MHRDGKINDKFPIFNDLLCFLWCKIKLCAKDVLINVMKQYYRSEEIMKARDIVYDEFPPNEDDVERRVKHRKAEDALGAIYNIFQNLPTDDPPVLASINLNNIPYVELKNVDGAAMMWQQGQMKDQLQEMVGEQAAIKAQLATIVEHLREKKLPENEGVRNNETTQLVESYNEVARRNTSPTANTNARESAPAPTQPSSTHNPAPQPHPATTERQGGGWRGGSRGGHWQRQQQRGGNEGRDRSPFTPRGRGRGQHREGNRPSIPGIDGVPWGPRISGGGDRHREERMEQGDRAPRGYSMDEDGWMTREPRERRPPPILGRKKGTRLQAVPPPLAKARIFLSRLNPNIPAEEIKEYVREIANVESIVERIQSRNTAYASFVITVDRGAEERVLDPDEWQEGLIVRPFRGQLRRRGDDTLPPPAHRGHGEAREDEEERNGRGNTQGNEEH